MSTTAVASRPLSPSPRLSPPAAFPPSASTIIGGLGIAVGAYLRIPSVAIAGAALLGRNFLRLRIAQNLYAQHHGTYDTARVTSINMQVRSLYAEMVREGLTVDRYNKHFQPRLGELDAEQRSIQQNPCAAQDPEMRKFTMYFTVLRNVLQNFRDAQAQPALEGDLKIFDQEVRSLYDRTLTPTRDLQPLIREFNRLSNKYRSLSAALNGSAGSTLQPIWDKLLPIHAFLQGKLQQLTLKTVLFAAQKLLVDLTTPIGPGDSQYSNFLRNRCQQYRQIHQVLQGIAAHQIPNCPEYFETVRLLHRAYSHTLFSGLFSRDMAPLPPPLEILPPASSRFSSAVLSTAVLGLAYLLGKVFF